MSGPNIYYRLINNYRSPRSVNNTLHCIIIGELNVRVLYTEYGPGSVFCIATGYGLDGPGIESQWGARFSAPVQTGPGAHPASCTMGTVSFPGVKRPRRDAESSPLLVPWSRKGRAIPLLPLWAVWPVHSLSACTRVFYLFYLYSYCSI